MGGILANFLVMETVDSDGDVSVFSVVYVNDLLGFQVNDEARATVVASLKLCVRHIDKRGGHSGSDLDYSVATRGRDGDFVHCFSPLSNLIV